MLTPSVKSNPIEYVSSISLVGDGASNNTLVTRRYVTEVALGILEFTPSGVYAPGDRAEWKGQIYKACRELDGSQDPLASPDESDAWELSSAPQIKKKSGTLTEIESTDVDIIHNIGTTYVMVQIFEKDTNNHLVYRNIPFYIKDENTITIQFDEVPTSEYQVVIFSTDY